MSLNKTLKEKVAESFSSVMPITLIVLLLSATVSPMPLGTLALFLAGAVLLVVGMGFFTLGADMAMMPIGQQAGESLTCTKKLWVIALSCFVIGIVITLAEPDLQVLARQTPAVPDMVLILTVAVGVGLFLMLAFLRILFRWKLSILLFVFYALIFVLAFLVPDSFLAVAFDSGGVTTGPITVPFIMALGLGLTAVRSDKDAEDDSFGLVALCSIGPILSVLILGFLYHPSGSSYSSLQIAEISDTKELFAAFGRAFPDYIEEVAFALTPILALFFLLNFLLIRLRRRQLVKILVGLFYTFIGLMLFLTGVNVGFMPAGYFLGSQICSLPYRWILIPLAMVIGYFIVKAEPAVLVLNKQVEQITGGAISQRAMMSSLSIGMAVSLGLSMTRVLTGLSVLWFLVPGYALALGLSLITPNIFTAIAFDSGGVASGPMTATFLLPFAMGACDEVGGNILTDAFGIVAMVAMTPLVIIQLLGLLYQLKARHLPAVQREQVAEEEIIDLQQEGSEDA